MEISILANHLLITLVAWIAGLIVGGGLGFLIFGLVRPWLSEKSGGRRVFTSVLWRTLEFALVLVVWSLYIPFRLGLGNITGMMMGGLTVSLLTLPMTIYLRLNDWFPPSPRVKFILRARTLLFFALFTTLGAGFVGGGGAGFDIMQQMNLMEFGRLIQVFLLGC